jgi:ATP-dependent DNA helicase RecG
VGVSDIDSNMLKIKDRIKNNISPSAMGLFDVVAENKEGKELIKIFVAGGTEKPYFKKKFGMTEKGCFYTYRNCCGANASGNDRQVVCFTYPKLAW